MTQFTLQMLKDLGLQREVMNALPYAVVGGAWEGSFESPASEMIALNHIVPNGQQLKILFLRVWTQEAQGARFSIYQTNPTAAGATGSVEAYPVVGNTPSGTRDYPFLEAPGAEVLRGSLIDPVHVLEGSIDFKIHDSPSPSTGNKYSITWWGVEKVPQEHEHTGS